MLTYESKDVPLNKVFVDDNHSRISHDETAHQDLMKSIQEYGMLQALVVVAVGDKYKVLAGHRRHRAASKLGLATVPVRIVAEGTDLSQIDEIAICDQENSMRVNPSLIDLGRTCVRQLDQNGLTLEEIAIKLGRDVKQIKDAVHCWKSIPKDWRQRIIPRDRVKKGEGRNLFTDLKALRIVNVEKAKAMNNAEWTLLCRVATLLPHKTVTTQNLKEMLNIVRTQGMMSPDKLLATWNSSTKKVKAVQVDLVFKPNGDQKVRKAFKGKYDGSMSKIVYSVIKNNRPEELKTLRLALA